MVLKLVSMNLNQNDSMAPEPRLQEVQQQQSTNFTIRGEENEEELWKWKRGE